MTGARWGLDGAEALLKLRSVWNHGDWDAYGTYPLEQEQRRVHFNQDAAEESAAEPPLVRISSRRLEAPLG